MIWHSLAAVRASLLEFSRASGYREAHCLVQLANGGWTRTLGAPQGCIHVRRNVWRQVQP